MNEHSYSLKLRKALQATGHVFHWKIHDPYAGGVPDHFIEGPTRDLWLESKHISELPKRDTTIIDLCNEKSYLSKLQQMWLHRRSQKRGDAAVLVSCDEGAVIMFDREWEEPMTTEFFRFKLQHFDDIVRAIVLRT